MTTDAVADFLRDRDNSAELNINPLRRVDELLFNGLTLVLKYPDTERFASGRSRTTNWVLLPTPPVGYAIDGQKLPGHIRLEAIVNMSLIGSLQVVDSSETIMRVVAFPTFRLPQTILEAKQGRVERYAHSEAVSGNQADLNLLEGIVGGIKEKAFPKRQIDNR